MVLTNPHIKPRIEFIVMKIFMKIVKICPKSPQFTVISDDSVSLRAADPLIMNVCLSRSVVSTIEIQQI